MRGFVAAQVTLLVLGPAPAPAGFIAAGLCVLASGLRLVTVVVIAVGPVDVAVFTVAIHGCSISAAQWPVEPLPSPRMVRWGDSLAHE